MHGISTLYGRQPVMVLAFVQASVALLVGFGLNLTGDQVALVMAFAAALLGLIAKSQVTPMATLPDHVAAAVYNASHAKIPKIPYEPPAIED